jgi:hypothetical protein
MLLANWFEIDDKEYLVYWFKGYNIDANSDRVIWWLNGKRHRTDGPAVIWEDGDQWWLLNDNPHRTDGPAIIRANGTQIWYLNGQVYTEQEWQNAVSELV